MKTNKRTTIEFTLSKELYILAEKMVKENYNGDWEKYIETLILNDK